jgi:hypothetical protein
MQQLKNYYVCLSFNNCNTPFLLLQERIPYGMFRTIFAGAPHGLMHAVFTHDNHDVSPVTNAFSGAESFTADSVIMSEHGRLWLNSLMKRES